MAAGSTGWKLRPAKGRNGAKSEIQEVYFSWNGRRYFRSTGHSDLELAKQAAARIYADVVQREPEAPRQVSIRRGDSPALSELVASWLEQDASIAASTSKTWIIYGRKWCRRWQTLVDVSEATCAEYRNDLLRSVVADTARKELGALRRFLDWCTANGHLRRKVDVPFVPKKATGTRYAKRRRKTAPPVSPEECEAIIELLPEWARRGGNGSPVTKSSKGAFPVRARMRVQYETGLRSSFLDVMRAPEHYRRGADCIDIPPEHDKNRLGRRVRITQRCREELDKVCPDIGPIFGAHDYRIPIGEAASKVLRPEYAAIFTATHLRSAQATHTLELTGNIPGAMHQFGWTQVATTSRYTKPSERAGAATIEARDRVRAEALKAQQKPGA